MTESMEIPTDDDIEAWRELHRNLIEAVKAAEEAVASQTAQRRYWLEEICANLDDDGTQQTSSVWNRPLTLTKKMISKRAPSASKKRKKSLEQKPAKKPRKRKSQEAVVAIDPAPAPDDSYPRDPSPSPKSKSPVSQPEHFEEDDRDSSGGNHHEYYAEHESYHQHPHHQHRHHPHPSQQGHWGNPGSQNLQMMAAVAFGANQAGYPHQMMGHPTPPPPPPPQYNPYYHHPHHHGPPPMHHHPHHQPPMHGQHYPSHPRTYTSLEDVGNSDDDSDQDKF